jgi:hypothetical protein
MDKTVHRVHRAIQVSREFKDLRVLLEQMVLMVSMAGM